MGRSVAAHRRLRAPDPAASPPNNEETLRTPGPARPRSPPAPVPERPEPTIRPGRSHRLRRPFSCRYTTSRDLPGICLGTGASAACRLAREPDPHHGDVDWELDGQ